MCGMPGAVVGDATSKSFGSTGSPYNPEGYVEVPYSPMLNSGKLTVEMWVKLNNLNNSPACPLCSRGSGAANGFLFFANNGGDGKWWFRTYNGTTRNSVTSTALAQVGVWTLLTGVYDGTQTHLYVNGVEAAPPVTGTYVPQTDSILRIGAGPNEAALAWYWPGNIAEVAIYTNNLDVSTIKSHYENGTNASRGTSYDALVLASNPAGYWRMNETVTPTTPNLGSLGNAATGYYSGGANITLGQAGPQSPTFPGFETGNVGIGNAANGFVQTGPLYLNTNTVTFECWIKPNGAQAGYTGLIFGRDNSTATGLMYGGGGVNLGYHWNGGYWDWDSGLTPVDEEWNYAAVTISPSQAVMYLYNSSGFNTAAHNVGHGNWACNDNIRLCVDNGGRTFVGALDEAAVYNKVLTEGQIRTHALAGFGDVNPPVLMTDPPLLYAATLPTIWATQPFTLSVDAYGQPPLTYQWTHAGTNIPGATASTYVKTATLADSGDYTVVVGNSHGQVTSQPVTVTVTPANRPAIATQPASRTMLAPGGTVTLFVVVSNTPPYWYQWQHAGTNLPGATSSSLAISNLQDGINTGTYRVTVMNIVGSTNSANATVTIVAPTANSYASYVVADGPTAYWRLDETSGPTIYDSVGGFDGTCYSAGAINDGSAFGMSQTGPLNGDPDTCIQFNAASTTKIDVPYSTVLDQPQFTVEFWCDALSVQQFAVGPLTFRTGGPYDGWGIYVGWDATTHAEPYSLGGPFIGVGSGGWVGTTAYTNFALATWVHVAFSYDGANLLYYVNGQLVSSAASAVYPPHYTPRPLRIGAGSTENDGNYWWDGLIDEVAVYPKSLSASRILQHYSVGKNGASSMPEIVQQPVSVTNYATYTKVLSVSALGTPPPTYQWTKDSTNITGATLSTLSFSSLKLSDSGTYAVTVSNRMGVVTSSNAVLQVVALPTAPYTAAIVAARPVAYYHLDETNTYVDTVVTEAINFGFYNGTYINYPLLGEAGATKNTGTSVSFDGSGQHVDLAALDWLQIIGQITLEAWIKPGDSYATTMAHIVGRGPGAYAGTPREVSLRIVNGAYQIRRWQANVGEIGASFTMPLEDVGSWVYLAGTFDGIAWHLYRNGVEVASTPDTAGSGNADGGWAIAARAATPFDVADSFFMGNVDEVAIYNYALTPSQVTQHYTGVSAPTLSIAPAADKLVITWQGQLLQAPNVTGPWTTNTTAVSPWTNTPSGTRGFYRALAH